MAIIGTNDTATVRVAILPSGAAFDNAANVSFSPTGRLTSNTVQTALVELDGATNNIVATRTALKALNTSLVTVAFLSENGREGYFKWDETIPLATHQADTQEGIYIAPDASSDGAWVRIFSTSVNVKWFGAKGDGSTNDSAAIAAALAYMDNASTVAVFYLVNTLYFPYGRYIAQGTFTYSGNSLSIKGDGPYTSVIDFTAAGGFVATVPDTGQCVFEDVGLRASVQNCGTAVTLTGLASASSNLQHAIFRRVQIFSDFGNTGWDRGISLTNIWHYLIDSVFFKGSSLVADWGTFVELGGKSIDGRITNSYAYGCDTAIFVNSSTLEGLRIENCSFVAVNRGVYKPASSGQPPHYAILNTHIAAANSCIEINNASSVHLQDNLLYLSDQATVATLSNATAVFVNDAANVHIVDNSISGQATPIPVTKFGVLLANVSRYFVSKNYIDLFTVGVWSQSTSSNGFIETNEFFACSAKYDIDNATTVVIDRNGNLLINLNQTIIAARLGSDASNVTGDGTVYTVLFDEIDDIVSEYSTGVATIAHSGTYLIDAQILFKGLAGTHTDVTIRIDDGTAQHDAQIAAAAKTSFGWLTYKNSVTLDLSAGATISCAVIVGGTGKTVSVGAGSNLRIQRVS